MAHSDDFLSPRDQCEICGAELEDDIVIQEFADGSLARLCPECAAGAALTDLPPDEPEVEESVRPRKRRLFSRGRGAAASRRRDDDDDDTASWDSRPLEDDDYYPAEQRSRAEARAIVPPPEEQSFETPRVAAEVPPPSRAARAAAAKPPVSEPKPESPAPAPAPAPAHPVEPARPVWPAYVEADERIDQDILDKTRELLMPVADLIALQGEMQSALERLAGSLEQFAAEMLTDSQGKSSVINNRLQQLERELEITRSRLHEAESLLPETVAAETAPDPEAIQWPEEVAPITLDSLVAESRAAAAAAVAGAESAPETAPVAAPAAPDAEAAPAATVEAAPAGAAVAPTAEAPAVEAAPADAMPTMDSELTVEAPGPELLPEAVMPAVEDETRRVERTPAPRPLKSEPAKLKADRKPDAGPAARPIAPEPETAPWEARRPEINDGQITGTFAISEVQAAQRYYNESTFVDRIRDVRRSLGKPKASLIHLAGNQPQAILTIFWDIVWYQYIIDLRRDLPVNAPRVLLHREGMDLDELAFHFREKNSTVNDDGRLDASELEVHLLSDPSVLITEMPIEETQVLEDATEEIWEQRISPEFKWDG